MTNQQTTANDAQRGQWLRRWWTPAWGAVLLSGVLMTGCGGGGGSSDSTELSSGGGNDSGQLALALTDAEGDFLTYVVDVSSISLTRANGAVIEALPINTSVDFAQYVEISELLTMATVPAGQYTAITLNLDYSNADVTVQADNGDPLTASLVDSNGNALQQMAVSLELANGSDFTIRPGTPAHVTLDLDLDASNEVAIENGVATVTVDPILLADTQFENPKSMRLRGLLESVHEADNLFVMHVRPFRHRTGDFGSARVHVNDQTHYEIDGEVYDAQTGLSQLATMPAQTPIINMGQWNRDTGQYTAATVLAGSSVPWGDSDLIKGVVIARDANTITVRGAVIELANGQHRFDDNITLVVGDQTTVTQQLNGLAEAGIADIAIGSAITAKGTLGDDRTLDASEGHVRIRLSNLTGTVVSVSPLSVDLQRLSGRHPGLFDFSGTGTDASSDADPDNYEIDSSALNLSSLELGDPIKVRGLVSAMGTAPEDFEAQTLFDASEIKGHMVINYARSGSETAIAQASDDGIVFDLTDSSTRHHVKRANILTDLSEFESMPVVIPAEQTGIFAITRRGSMEIHRNFSDFVTALNNALAAGERVTRFDAHGEFNDSLVQMSSKRLRVGLTQ